MACRVQFRAVVVVASNPFTFAPLALRPASPHCRARSLVSAGSRSTHSLDVPLTLPGWIQAQAHRIHRLNSQPTASPLRLAARAPWVTVLQHAPISSAMPAYGYARSGWCIARSIDQPKLLPDFAPACRL